MQQYGRPLRMGKPLQECNLRTCMELHGRWFCAIMHARCSEQIENVRSVEFGEPESARSVGGFESAGTSVFAHLDRLCLVLQVLVIASARLKMSLKACLSECAFAVQLVAIPQLVCNSYVTA